MTVVLLHGFMGSASGLGSLAEELEASLDDDVYALDLVGHGNRQAPTSPTAYTMDAIVTDVVQQVDGLGRNAPIDLFGYSMGGRIALSLAVAHPQMLRRLVVLGASPGLSTEAERQERVLSDEALAARLEHEGIEAFVDSWLDLPMFEGLRALGAQWFERYRQQRYTADPIGLANSLRGYGTGAMPPLGEQLREMSVPTLVLAGSRDAKFSAIGTSIAATLPVGTFEAIEHAGHAAHLEAEARVVAAITAFLSA